MRFAGQAIVSQPTGTEVAGGSWITPYRKQWIDHTSGKNPITDPVYRKELQDIILYPERTGLGRV